MLQRWSIRRVTLAAAMLAIFAGPPFSASKPAAAGQQIWAPHAPELRHGHTMILAAQAVPSAAFLPCIAALPSGWTAVGGTEIASGQASFGLDSGRAGRRAASGSCSGRLDAQGRR